MENLFEHLMMQRCLQLAKNGLGTTYPNPLVGSVITHNKKIIGEGWHFKSGEPHAEINAIQSVRNKSLLSDSTLFVNLEPCSHFGKTPPCAHKIVQMGIPRVVIGTRDYASHVNGRGIQYLKDHGVNVIENIMKEESTDLNKRFFTFHKKKRPYIILKWAQTANQYFAPLDQSQKWITSKYTQQLVHMWRTQEHAIMVGGKTIVIDNPTLNARLWKGNDPIKIVLSNSLTSINSYNIQKGEKTYIFNNSENTIKNSTEWIKVDSNSNIVEQILENLYHKGIQSVIVEGGKQILNLFINSNMWDESRVLTGSTSWESGIIAPMLYNGMIQSKELIGSDTFTLYKNIAL